MFPLFGGRKHDCRAHGYGSLSRVCSHLVGGEHLGWFVRRDPGAPDAAWPDAWCSTCNDAVIASGENVERALAALPFSAICDGCYELHRERNWPDDSAGKLASLIARARTELEARDRRFRARHDLGRFDWYDWEDGTRRLLLKKRSTGERLAATIQVVGSFSHKSHTWLWTWGHGDVAEPEKRRLRCIRSYGEEQHLLKLAVPHWPGTERDAWDMTAIASIFVASEGSYRLPHPNGHNYLLVLGAEELPASPEA